MNKETIRKNKRKARAHIAANGEYREALNSVVTGFLKDKSGCWAGYAATAEELSVDQAISENEHIDWVYPRVSGGDLVFIKNNNQTWDTSNWGVREPNERNPKVKIDDIDGFLVPGIAFDKYGHRLGYGKGYYDKTLSRTKAYKIGITHSELIVDELPHASHDVPMDAIATEKELMAI